MTISDGAPKESRGSKLAAGIANISGIFIAVLGGRLGGALGGIVGVILGVAVSVLVPRAWDKGRSGWQRLWMISVIYILAGVIFYAIFGLLWLR